MVFLQIGENWNYIHGAPGTNGFMARQSGGRRSSARRMVPKTRDVMIIFHLLLPSLRLKINLACRIERKKERGTSGFERFPYRSTRPVGSFCS
jgi:hypothetical protein